MSDEAILAKLAELTERLAKLERRQADHEKHSRLYVTNRELEGPKGDPTVKFDPRGWRGPSQKDRRFSQCPPDYLEMLADYFAWAAENPQEGKEKYASGNRLDARRARTWARRLRARTPGPEGVEPAPEAPAASGPPPRGRAAGGRPRTERPGRGAPPHTQASAAAPAPEEDDFLGKPEADAAADVDDFLGGGDSPGP